MPTPLKRYALTLIGDRTDRRIFYRRDANCPVITHIRVKNEEERVQIPAWLVNICEDGCLVTSDYFPQRADDVYMIVPGLGSKVFGTVRNQGRYTINLQFPTRLTAGIVEKISRLTLIPHDE
jgi:hypothetical protein